MAWRPTHYVCRRDGLRVEQSCGRKRRWKHVPSWDPRHCRQAPEPILEVAYRREQRAVRSPS